MAFFDFGAQRDTDDPPKRRLRATVTPEMFDMIVSAGRASYPTVSETDEKGNTTTRDATVNEVLAAMGRATVEEWAQKAVAYAKRIASEEAAVKAADAVPPITPDISLG